MGFAGIIDKFYVSKLTYCLLVILCEIYRFTLVNVK